MIYVQNAKHINPHTQPTNTPATVSLYRFLSRAPICWLFFSSSYFAQFANLFPCSLSQQVRLAPATTAPRAPHLFTCDRVTMQQQSQPTKPPPFTRYINRRKRPACLDRSETPRTQGVQRLLTAKAEERRSHARAREAFLCAVVVIFLDAVAVNRIILLGTHSNKPTTAAAKSWCTK